MATAVHRTIVFFPMQPLEGSPYARKSWEEILPNLHACLQQAPNLVCGYTIGNGDGNWFDEKSNNWLIDRCTVIEIYTPPGFAGEHRNPKTPAARFLASLSYLSCVQMGHDVFLAIVNNQRCLGDGQGLHIGPDEDIVAYREILP